MLYISITLTFTFNTKLNEALKKYSVYEVENTEQKTVISDLTEKVAALKEKVTH